MARPFFSAWFLLKYGRGKDVVDADWDNLIILDAYRYDDFESVNNLDGELQQIVSKGSDSPMFMEKTFSGRTLHIGSGKLIPRKGKFSHPIVGGFYFGVAETV